MIYKDNNYELFNERKQKDFLDKYPLCFPNGEPYCGFYCGYGWWDILDKLCSAITNELSNLPENERNEFQVAQIKEKFGGLRFYVDGGNTNINKLISEAEKESFSTCEECSAPGTASSEGWVKVYCPSCREKQEEIRKNKWC